MRNRLTLEVCLLTTLFPVTGVAAQQTSIRGFTDVIYHASDAAGSSSAFGLGQFDLYITSRLSDRWSFLGESVFEYDDVARDFVVDVERVIVTYSLSDHLRFAAGKHHTPLGYWNNAFHHGALLQPTIERPLLVAFEDEGGMLPIHGTGVLAAGRDLTPLHLGFDVLVANGLGGTPTSDDNQTKAVTVALSSQVTSALQVGANVYVDRMSPGTEGPGGGVLGAPTRQRIAGGYAAYLGPVLEGIVEYQHVEDRATGSSTAGNDGMFAYGGWRFGKAVAYGRYDRLAFAASDPYYALAGVKMGTVGARYDFNSSTTAKLELRRREPSGTKRSNEIAAQVAIGF